MSVGRAMVGGGLLSICCWRDVHSFPFSPSFSNAGHQKKQIVLWPLVKSATSLFSVILLRFGAYLCRSLSWRKSSNACWKYYSLESAPPNEWKSNTPLPGGRNRRRRRLTWIDISHKPEQMDDRTIWWNMQIWNSKTDALENNKGQRIVAIHGR